MPTVVTPATSEGNHPSTLPLTKELCAEIIQPLNVNVDPTLLFAQFGATSIPPTTAQQNAPTLQPEADDVPAEKEHDVAANLAAKNSEADERNMEVDGDQIVGWNPTERVKNIADETPENREVVNATYEEEGTEKVPPKDEAAEARAAAVRTYQRRPAREETSGKRSGEERPIENPIRRTGEIVNSPARTSVGASRRRRMVLMDEESDEEEDVLFTPIDALLSSGQPNPPAAGKTEKEKRGSENGKGRPSLPHYRRNKGGLQQPW